MPKFIFYTYAYNAEKTLERTIKSVQAQTVTNWVYYLVDNGSTDRTGELIRKYAEEDARIIPLRNAKNHVWEPGNSWPYVMWQNPEEDLFCFLDADDEYKPQFLENMYSFMERYHLEMAACGNDFIEEGSMALKRVRTLSRDLIVEDMGFSALFPRYHEFMRTLWGKLYRISLLRRYAFTGMECMLYGSDTVMTLGHCKNAARMGVLARSLHRYYVSPASISYQVTSDRINGILAMHQVEEEFLRAKCGRVSSHNQDFLLCVFLNELCALSALILDSDIPVLGQSGKLELIFSLFDNRPARQVLSCENLGKLFGFAQAMERRTALCSRLGNWLLTLEEVPDARIPQYCELGELLCAAGNEPEGWILFQKLRIMHLLEQGLTDAAGEKIKELESMGISFS